MRIADKTVYENENYLLHPKEMHKEVMKVISNYMKPNLTNKILDVGCANGNFLYLLNSIYGHDFDISLTGLDIHKNLLDIAKKNIPDFREICMSIEDMTSEIGSFDLITCLGVLSIFDDFSHTLEAMCQLLAEKGVLIIATEFNEHPIDVIVRYRESNSNGEFQRGWNIISKESVENILNKKDDVKYKWVDFNMPFPIDKTDDPMRAWTIQTERNPCQQVNGAQQLINQSILIIQRTSQCRK